MKCFGRLDTVFPLGEDGLRTVTPSCTACEHVKACLAKAAQSQDGVEMQAEKMASMGQTPGVAGFLQRWSRLKGMRTRAGSISGSQRKKG